MQILEALLHLCPDKPDLFFRAHEVAGHVYRISSDMTRCPPVVSFPKTQYGNYSVDLSATFFIRRRDRETRRLATELIQ
jgi:hypothetical protein